MMRPGVLSFCKQLAVRPQRVHPHVGRLAQRCDRRQPRVLVQRIEVPHPHHVIRQVRHKLATRSQVHEAPDVPLRIRYHAHLVRAQRPYLGYAAMLVPLQPPERRAPQRQVSLRRPPQVASAPERVRRIQQPLQRVLRAHGFAARPRICAGQSPFNRPGMIVVVTPPHRWHTPQHLQRQPRYRRPVAPLSPRTR